MPMSLPVVITVAALVEVVVIIAALLNIIAVMIVSAVVSPILNGIQFILSPVKRK